MTTFTYTSATYPGQTWVYIMDFDALELVVRSAPNVWMRNAPRRKEGERLGWFNMSPEFWADVVSEEFWDWLPDQ